MNLPPYALPLVIEAAVLALFLIALVLVKRSGWVLTNGRQAAVLGSTWGGFTVMIWRMSAPQNVQLPEGADSIINTLFTINFVLLLAGGEDPGPAQVAVAEERGRAAATAEADERHARLRSETASAIADHIRAKDHTLPLDELADQVERFGRRKAS